MSIKNAINELERIKLEISRNNAQNRMLRKRLHELETQISDYLRSKSQAVVNYNGRTIVLETKERYNRKPKVDKKNDTLLLLKNLGVENPSDAYDQLQRVQKGDPIEKYKLKIKQIKN